MRLMQQTPRTKIARLMWQVMPRPRSDQTDRCSKMAAGQALQVSLEMKLATVILISIATPWQSVIHTLRLAVLLSRDTAMTTSSINDALGTIPL